MTPPAPGAQVSIEEQIDAVMWAELDWYEQWRITMTDPERVPDKEWSEKCEQHKNALHAAKRTLESVRDGRLVPKEDDEHAV